MRYFLELEIASIFFLGLGKSLMLLFKNERLGQKDPRWCYQNDYKQEFIPVGLIIDQIKFAFVGMIAEVQKQLNHFVDNRRRILLLGLPVLSPFNDYH